MKIAIVDVCDTLYSSNTTFDFLDSIASTEIEKKLLSLRKNKWLMLLNSIFFKLFNMDFYRRLCVYIILSGKEVNDIKLKSEFFVDNVLCGKKIFQSHEIIENLKKEYQISLCSASIEPVVEVIARRLNCSMYFSSNLSVANNKYTGFIKGDLLGRKKEYLQKINIHYDLVITDNKSDLDLIKASKNSIIISQAKDVRHWTHFKNKNKTLNIKVVKI
ncbi:hypothetical protein CB005_001730 [Salmonella enterica subsp. arizonae serovar 56:z4,z23:-]|nr:hypothetical protein [Salmonella enterica subsp. arizonae serovar 56:z4,z23:-]